MEVSTEKENLTQIGKGVVPLQTPGYCPRLCLMARPDRRHSGGTSVSLQGKLKQMGVPLCCPTRSKASIPLPSVGCCTENFLMRNIGFFPNTKYPTLIAATLLSISILMT